MWEWQSLLQTSHLCVVSGRMELLPSFLRARLSGAAAISLSSPVLRCCFRTRLHFVRSAARPSQDIVSMSTAFISLTQTSFISKVRLAGGSPPQSQLSVEDVFWNATILHTTDMTQPSQSALSNLSVHSGKTSTRQYISVGYFILLGYSQDTADASQVECVEPSLLLGIYVFHVSLPYNNVLITQALQTASFDFTDSLGLVHTRALRRARVEAAFPILLLISASKERLSVMVEPR